MVNDLEKCLLDSSFTTRRLPRGTRFMHDLIPTQVLLPSVRLQATVSCVPCDEADMILHWLTTCIVTHELWQWIRQRTAALLRTDPLPHLPHSGYEFLLSSYGQHRKVMLQSERQDITCPMSRRPELCHYQQQNCLRRTHKKANEQRKNDQAS